MNDIFSIFNPDWWMDENNNALQMTDAVLFLLLGIPVAYLFIYALASLRKYKNPYPPSPKQHRFLVLFVVLKNGKEVIESINHFLDTQMYPREKYDIAVAATQLSEEDLVTLLQMSVNIVVPDKEHCTKIYAIQQVMERYSPHEYDAITIFNSDNKVVPNALELFNNAYYSGCDAIQAHRMTENLNTNIAVLNATSEEINNHLFRKAHTALGFSSALIGSGMMFDFEMFQEIAPRLSGSDLAKSYRNGTLEGKHIYRIHGRNSLLLQKDGRYIGVQQRTPTLVGLTVSQLHTGIATISDSLLTRKVGFMRKIIPMATSIPFSAHLIYHDMCRGNNIPGVAACYKMVCTFSRFIHHFFDGHARRGNQPQIPERFLVSAHIGSHLFHEPHHKNL